MEISLKEIADIVEGKIHGDADKTIQRAAAFDSAEADDITFLSDRKRLKNLHTTRAGAVLVPENITEAPVSLISVKNPQIAFIKVFLLFNPEKTPDLGISSTACIGPDFKCGRNISIGHSVVIAENVTLGDQVAIGPGAVIEEGVTIGNDVRIYPNVSILERCRIGDRVIIHAGTVIGSDGFGFVPDGKKYLKIPHAGTVRIDDDCEIGACNTIDRGTLGDTWIKRGVKTDNLVHVAHNVTIGEDSVLAAQGGIAGSTTIGDHAVLAGQMGISGHLIIGNDVTVGPRAGVAKSVSDGSVVSGAPEMPHRLWLRVQNLIPKLPELAKKISKIEKMLEKDTK